MTLFKKIRNLGNQFLERFFYGINFISLGKYGFINKNAKVLGCRIYGNVSIAEGCKIIGGVSLKTASEIKIGKYTSVNGPNTDVFAQINPIHIGSFTSIARNVSIQEFNHNYKTITSYSILQNIFGEEKKADIYSNGAIEIGHDVWIGTQCIILSGAKIGNGAIIAANSVVVGQIPPYAICGGSPAKVLKYRFDQEAINLLEQIEWWNWPLEKIKQNKNLFKGELDIELLKSFLTKN